MNKKREDYPSYFVKLCTGKAAYEAKFSQNLRFDMSSVKKAFEDSKRYQIMLFTPHLIILKNAGRSEITFSKDGRMLIKEVSSKNQAEAVVEDVLQVALRASAKIREISAP